MKFIIKNLNCISYYQYLSSNKRFVTKRGKEYRKSFLFQINKQMAENNYTLCESKNLFVKVHFVFDNRRCNDIENALKVPLDLLEGIAYTNDRWIQRLELSKEAVIKPKLPEYNLTIEIIDLDASSEPVDEIEQVPVDIPFFKTDIPFFKD